ncbi:MAG: helix-turn-helix domain-containing protein [Ruminococcus flavefaciens]|nr:helix-turn-helix domain-containing protein [Ruminococcus flavefaciens]
MLKEITQKEALQATLEGKEVKVFKLESEAYRSNKRTGRKPQHPDGTYEFSLFSDLLKNCCFVIDEQQERPPEVAENKARDEPDDTGRNTPPDGRKGRKQIDTGKIMALHKAGWSNAKIADEMHLHPITVGKYIKQLTQEGAAESEE